MAGCLVLDGHLERDEALIALKLCAMSFRCRFLVGFPCPSPSLRRLSLVAKDELVAWALLLALGALVASGLCFITLKGIEM